MSQAVLRPNLTKKCQWEVSQIDEKRFPPATLLGGLSVNLNHLKIHKGVGCFGPCLFFILTLHTLRQWLDWPLISVSTLQPNHEACSGPLEKFHKIFMSCQFTRKPLITEILERWLLVGKKIPYKFQMTLHQNCQPFMAQIDDLSVRIPKCLALPRKWYHHIAQGSAHLKPQTSSRSRHSFIEKKLIFWDPCIFA